MSEAQKAQRAVAALEAMAATWAASVGVRASVQTMLQKPDSEARIVAYIQQAHMEGLYEGRISHSTAPRRLSDPEARDGLQQLIAEACSSKESAIQFLKEGGFLTADGKLAPEYGGDGVDSPDGAKR
jgi:hypothetical protein